MYCFKSEITISYIIKKKEINSANGSFRILILFVKKKNSYDIIANFLLREINHNFKCHSTSMDISSISNDIIYKINQSLPLISSFIENREWKNKSSPFLKENQVCLKEVKCFFFLLSLFMALGVH